MYVKFYVYHDHMVLSSQFMLDLLNEMIQYVWLLETNLENGIVHLSGKSPERKSYCIGRERHRQYD